MYRIFLVFVFLFSFSNIYGQKRDSLYVIEGDNGWLLPYTAKSNQNIVSLSQQFHVPLALFASTNNYSLQQQISAGTRLLVPIGTYNLAAASQIKNAIPIYFKSKGADNFRRIARFSQTSQRAIQELNNYYEYEMYKGQVLLVGWVLFNAQNNAKQLSKNEYPSKAGFVVDKTTLPKKNVVYLVDGDTIRSNSEATIDTVMSEGEKLFQQQTFNGESVSVERGTAAFYNRPSRNSSGIYFAFYNAAKKGTIIKIHNPGTGKTIYAKVIGTVPTTPNFHNAIIGLSTDAKRELLVPGDKAWCELSYAP